MRLLTLLVLVLHAVQMETQEKVSAYAGENVTLASGAKNGQSLVRIEWSVYGNTTWIATLHNGFVNTDRHDQFQKRLALNTRSGDLTIYHLTSKDAMTYTVEIIDSNGEDNRKKIELEVKQRLQVPTIEKIDISATQEGCFIALNCSSSEKDVNFSWQVSPPSMASWSTKNGSSYIFVLTNSKQGLLFTCNSTKGDKSAHQDFSAGCDVFTEELSHLRNRFIIPFYIGIVLGILITSVLIFCCKIVICNWRGRQNLKREAAVSSP
uniref:Ig-like domain-containing protein n=1 Tax=Oryzias sinensis TaxID=183150 RepID=A0A8C7WW72_9TELE